MSKYLYVYSLSLQNVLQRRASLLMDRVGGLAAILALYFFWSALLGQDERFLGYSRAQMLSYVLAVSLLRSFAFTGRGWEVVGEIASGRISSYLLRPLSYQGYCLAQDFAQKTVHALAALLEIGALIYLLKAPLYVPTGAWTLPLFALAALLSSLIFFYMEFFISNLAFWTSQSGGPLFCFELFLQFAAGAFFPLDVLPHPLQAALRMTPFPYLVFFPVNIYLERVPPGEALRLLGLQAAWLLLVASAVQAFWKRGVRSYAAEGG